MSHCLYGYLVIYLKQLTHTAVSSSPPLEILPLEYMAVLESMKLISKCVVCEGAGRKLVSVVHTNTSFL